MKNRIKIYSIFIILFLSGAFNAAGISQAELLALRERVKNNSGMSTNEERILSHYNSWRRHFYDVNRSGESKLGHVWNYKKDQIALGCIGVGLLAGIPAANMVVSLNNNFPRVFPSMRALALIGTGAYMVPQFRIHYCCIEPSIEEQIRHHISMALSGAAITGGCALLKKTITRG